jgi:putative nucleotidyltransferase with HDIG domain
MPGMNGSDLVDCIVGTYPEIPAVMITGQSNLETALSAIRRGAYDFLAKPFGRGELMVTVERALEHRRLRLENVAYRQDLEAIGSERTKQLRKALVDLGNSYDIILEALGDALDLKDAETFGHSRRVTAYTLALARAAGCNADEIQTIARGAFLHDIGKMAIPDAILLKPGKLTDFERDIMREHCAIGYNMVRKIPFLDRAAEIVYCHQERYDGTGYPQGLRGREIPKGARLFSIADTLDAITSNRHYRKAESFSVAREEIRRHAGTQFDPDLVEIFSAMPDALWEELRSEISARYSDPIGLQKIGQDPYSRLMAAAS